MKFTIAIEAGTTATAFGVAVPDLPGCFSAGDTVEEAFDNVREAIEAFCEVLAADGKDLPQTKSMSEWQNTLVAGSCRATFCLVNAPSSSLRASW